MAYVMVTADFPDISDADRKRIYSALEQMKWEKIQSGERDISTVWQGDFDSAPELQALTIARKEFESSAESYCKPRLALHYGPNKPMVF